MAVRSKKSQTKKSQKERKIERNLFLKSNNNKRQSAELTLEEKPAVKYQAEDSPVIGMGASAGGLEAFENFFKNMPPDSGAAFVLISHLSPDQKSLMPEILQKHTKMKVYQIEEGMTVKPNCIYVIPPSKDAILKDRTLHLIEPYVSKGIRHPIDVFFRSLADDLKEKASAPLAAPRAAPPKAPPPLGASVSARLRA